MSPDPLVEAMRRLGDATVPAREIELTVTAPPGADPAQTAIELRAGLYDILAERALARCADDRSREELLRIALADVAAVEPVLSFTLAERARRTEQLERAARMRGRQNRLTGAWLVPRLEREIELYEARVSGLEAALEEVDR